MDYLIADYNVFPAHAGIQQAAGLKALDSGSPLHYVRDDELVAGLI